VDVKGELKPVELVKASLPIFVEAKAGSESAWSKGPPLVVKTAPASSTSTSTETSSTGSDLEAPSQEIEILPPTPSFAHLMPPISAWTNYSNDSDPAGAWDPAQKTEYPIYQQVEYYDNTQQQQQQQQHQMAMYPWGIPMTPPVGAYGSQTPHIPGGPGVLWTPNGWAVQDAAMKKVLGRVERSSMGHGRNVKPGGVKGYYRSESLNSSDIDGC
jgi:hypothetical protein